MDNGEETFGISSEIKQESRDEMLSRHRKEIAELQNKEMGMKKAAAKGSKAEQKAKKKQVEDEISQLSSQLMAKHSEELAFLGYNIAGQEKGNINNLVMAIAGVSINNQGDSSKPSKGAKRREKRAQQEAAREQRIQEEQSNIVSDRMIENEKLEKKLEPLGLTINEIKPDGHCLYRAVEDQLSFHSRSTSPYTYTELRRMAANYMREREYDFLPFFLSDNKIEVDSGISPSERFQQYCKEVESTAAWGGQLEKWGRNTKQRVKAVSSVQALCYRITCMHMDLASITIQLSPSWTGEMKPTPPNWSLMLCRCMNILLVEREGGPPALTSVFCARPPRGTFRDHI